MLPGNMKPRSWVNPKDGWSCGPIQKVERLPTGVIHTQVKWYAAMHPFLFQHPVSSHVTYLDINDTLKESNSKKRGECVGSLRDTRNKNTHTQFNLIPRNSSLLLGRPQVTEPVGIVTSSSFVLFSRSRKQTPLLLKWMASGVNVGKPVSLLSGPPMTPTVAAISTKTSTSGSIDVSTTWPNVPFIGQVCVKQHESNSFCNALLNYVITHSPASLLL